MNGKSYSMSCMTEWQDWELELRCLDSYIQTSLKTGEVWGKQLQVKFYLIDKAMTIKTIGFYSLNAFI